MSALPCCEPESCQTAFGQLSTSALGGFAPITVIAGLKGNPRNRTSPMVHNSRFMHQVSGLINSTTYGLHKSGVNVCSAIGGPKSSQSAPGQIQPKFVQLLCANLGRPARWGLFRKADIQAGTKCKKFAPNKKDFSP
jgi:hypothetical protein